MAARAQLALARATNRSGANAVATALAIAAQTAGGNKGSAQTQPPVAAVVGGAQKSHRSGSRGARRLKRQQRALRRVLHARDILLGDDDGRADDTAADDGEGEDDDHGGGIDGDGQPLPSIVHKSSSTRSKARTNNSKTMVDGDMSVLPGYGVLTMGERFLTHRNVMPTSDRQAGVDDQGEDEDEDEDDNSDGSCDDHHGIHGFTHQPHPVPTRPLSEPLTGDHPPSSHCTHPTIP